MCFNFTILKLFLLQNVCLHLYNFAPGVLHSLGVNNYFLPVILNCLCFDHMQVSLRVLPNLLDYSCNLSSDFCLCDLPRLGSDCFFGVLYLQFIWAFINHITLLVLQNLHRINLNIPCFFFNVGLISFDQAIVLRNLYSLSPFADYGPIRVFNGVCFSCGDFLISHHLSRMLQHFSITQLFKINNICVNLYHFALWIFNSLWFYNCGLVLSCSSHLLLESV